MDLITPFAVELKCCYEYLHITHSEFKKLPLKEKLKVIMYENLERERQGHFQKKAREKQQHEKEKMEIEKLKQGQVKVRTK